MKTIFKYITCLFSSALMLSACSSDWLVTEPTDSTSKNDILSTTENAKMAINGICKTMVSQHGYYGQSFNGEGTMKLLYGEYPGQDLNFPYMSPGWAPILNGKYTENRTSIYGAYPWYFYYLIIGNANSIIAGIDNAKGTDAERQFIKAEAFTIRAYAYSRLVTIYCDSWAKSNNGSTDGVALRLDESDGDIALSSLAICYDQIYKDLDNAIDLFKKSGLDRDAVYTKAIDTNCFPNINVAYAVYARTALDKNDYPNALKYAKLARENYPLMNTADYQKGFAASTSEWIWSVYNDVNETVYYYGWQLNMACNGYNAMNNINICINRSLVESFPETDIRKGLFLTESRFLPAGKTFKEVVLGDAAGSSTGKFSNAEASSLADTYVRGLVKKGYLPADVPVQAYAYASLKFQSTGQPAVGCQPLIRSSEMVLIEAEANYFLNNGPDAQKNLIELNKTSLRDPSYTCDKTGNDLLKEIKTYRRLELFGEGFSWFDCKRWGDNVVRNGFDKNGNYYSAVAGTYGDLDAFWKWSIPKRETDYNSAIK